jgi:predicted transcriptional regulator
MRFEMGKPKKAAAKTHFSMRLAPDLRLALVKAGEAEERPAAWIATKAIEAWLREKGYLK